MKGPPVHAAVVRSFDRPPRYEDFATPEPGPGELLVEVVAAGLHPRVRSGANNSHYTSGGELPMIPGVDAVGRRADGQLIFFVAGDPRLGTMADYAVAEVRRSVDIPDGLDPAVVAAAMNPAMSSWVALRRRIDFPPGQRVLVLGATGNAGRLAVQIARRLGAVEVVAAGRNAQRLAGLSALGADVLVALAGAATDIDRAFGAAAEVDVVIDYLGGAPAEQALTAIVTQRADRSRPLTWIHIGAVAGLALSVPSELLRRANLTIVGSGVGSVGVADYIAEFPAVLAELRAGHLSVNAVPVPLADVETAWTAPRSGTERIVFTPS